MADSEAPPQHLGDAPSFSVTAQGHALTFYPGGSERLEALIGLIDGARERLVMVFYIFAVDDCGARVRDALAAAARRGVDVRIIVDGFGADADAEFFAPLIEAGGTFGCFQANWSRRYLIRNHQKIVLADGRIAMLGGFNVEDGYFAAPGQDGWADLGFTVEGPVIRRIENWLAQLEQWVANRSAQFNAIRRMVREWDGGTEPVQLLIGGPTRGLSSWARCVSRDFVEGGRLDMVMAYFSPPPHLFRRMRRIARRGHSRIVLPSVSDNGATIGAARAHYAKLLEAGARLWEYQPCKLHTKLIVLDDAVYLGSANFDMRSLYLNLEIVLRIEDKALADRMREYIATQIGKSREITLAEHCRHASIWNRIRWRLSWFLVSVVDYTISRRLNLGL